MKMRFEFAGALLGSLVLTSCAPFVLSPDTPEKDFGKLIIPSLRAVKIPSSVPESELFGIWRSGDWFAGEGFELKVDHRFSESVRTDLMSGPYTWSGRWELKEGRIYLRPFRKADQEWGDTLQIAYYRGTLTLLPVGARSHVAGEGWTLEECYFKVKE